MSITKTLTYTLLLAGAFAMAACGGGNQNGTSSENGDEQMSQFASDEEFKNAHDQPTDASGEDKGQMITYDTPDGKTAKAYALMPETSSDKYLFVIHEWWGLNDNIKREAEQYFESLGDVNVMALDIYDGKVATNRDEAGQYMQAVKEDRARAIIQGALNKAGDNANIGTIGWCFGGGWSLRASIMAGERGKACVMYYGMPVQEADKLAPLEAPILGIFAQQDEWITPEVADKFEALAKATGKTIEIHQFDANHAFANPSQPSYNEEAAQKANALAREFLKDNMG